MATRSDDDADDKDPLDYFSHPLTSTDSVQATPHAGTFADRGWSETLAGSTQRSYSRGLLPITRHQIPDLGHAAEERRESDASDATLNDNDLDPRTTSSRFEVSDELDSSIYPYNGYDNISHPESVYSRPGRTEEGLLHSGFQPRVRFGNGGTTVHRTIHDREPGIQMSTNLQEQINRGRAGSTRLADLRVADENEATIDSTEIGKEGFYPRGHGGGARRPTYDRAESSYVSDIAELDPDDPRITGIRARNLDGDEQVNKKDLKNMNYRDRRKYLMRTKIEFHVSCQLP